MKPKTHSFADAKVYVLIATFLTACTGTGEEEVDRNADEAAIRSLLAENAAASSAGDVAGVAETYTADGDAWIAGLSRVSTHEGISSAEEDFGSLPGFQSWDPTIRGIRFISRDAAVVEVSAVTTLDMGKFDEEGTLVVARTEAGWKIAAARVMNFSETLLRLLKG